MGINKLQSYHFGLPNSTRVIDIRSEIEQWRRFAELRHQIHTKRLMNYFYLNRNHPGQTPLLVIDTMSLMNVIQKADTIENFLCGGRHHKYIEICSTLLTNLRSCGVNLVFFCDAKLQEAKIGEWLARKNTEYKENIELFDKIYSELSVSEIIASSTDELRKLKTTMNSIVLVAQQNGRFYYATQKECDAECAKYASDNKAIAILAYDSDFLIYTGDWKYWSIDNLNIETLVTRELDRNVLREQFQFTSRQLALWATLMGNDSTKIHFRKYLWPFYRNLGLKEYNFINVGRYVKRFHDVTVDDIKLITQNVFGHMCDDKFQLLADCIQSYMLEFELNTVTDPLLQRANSNALILQLISSTIPLPLPRFDMRDSDLLPYTERMKQMLSKSMGVFSMDNQYIKKTDTFTILSKQSHADGFSRRRTRKIVPGSKSSNIIFILTMLYNANGGFFIISRSFKEKFAAISNSLARRRRLYLLTIKFDQMEVTLLDPFATELTEEKSESNYSSTIRL